MGKRDTRLVVEEDTVYELDMDCVRSRRRQKKTCQKIQKKEMVLLWLRIQKTSTYLTMLKCTELMLILMMN